MKTLKFWFNLLIGLALIAGAVFCLYYIMYELFWTSLSEKLKIAIIPVSGPIIVAIIAFYINKHLERRKIYQQHVIDKKSDAYINFFSSYMKFQIGLANKTISDAKGLEILKDAFDKLIPELILWGSDEMVIHFRNYRQRIFKAEDKDHIILMFDLEKLILEMRKDIGAKNKNIKKGDILGSFITDIDYYLEKEQKEIS